MRHHIGFTLRPSIFRRPFQSIHRCWPISGFIRRRNPPAVQVPISEPFHGLKFIPDYRTKRGRIEALGFCFRTVSVLFSTGNNNKKGQPARWSSPKNHRKPAKNPLKPTRNNTAPFRKSINPAGLRLDLRRLFTAPSRPTSIDPNKKKD